jgi:acyl-CoA synthetase (AMP-forming)/AMP-acid ligase II
VLVYPPGSIHFTICFLACLKAGIVAVPVFPPNPTRRDTIAMFAVICQSAQCRVALTSTHYHHGQQLANIQQRIHNTLQWNNKQQNRIEWPKDLQWIVTDTLVSSSSSSKKKKKAQGDATTATTIPSSLPSLAFLQFTSGSTSDPKGVMITRDNLAHNLSMITTELQATHRTIVVSWLPMYHDMGLIGSFLGILYCGGTGYYQSPLAFLQQPMSWLYAISMYHATHLQAPNFAFKLVARKFIAIGQKNESPSLDLSSIRHVINAAEPVDTTGMKVFYETFGKFGLPSGVIYPTYGLAEHTVFVCSGGKQVLHVDKEQLEIHGLVQIVNSTKDDVTATNTSPGGGKVVAIVGCGYPARQGVDVQIVKDDGQALPEDVVGEIWVHSASKAAGYYGKPEESQHDFHATLLLRNNTNTNETTQQEQVVEYLRTGDLGFLHQSELFICGRLKDLIIVGGRNYYPQDLEATAEAVDPNNMIRPGCSAAFTIDPMAGTEVVALVMEVREDATSVKSSLSSLAHTIRAAIHQEHALGIASIMFLQKGTVPKTRSGKIARSWCRKAYNDGSLKIIHHESFRKDQNVVAPFEIEEPANTADATTARPIRLSPDEVRNLPKDEIGQRLIADLSQLTSVPPTSIDRNVPMISLMDSLTISQFKGMVETIYHVRPLSDGYLFRESCTVAKLSEVIKLGYAPDDGGEDTAPAAAVALPGQATGLAGKLGCPPGVVCSIM